jgi:hypothetical protein
LGGGGFADGFEFFGRGSFSLPFRAPGDIDDGGISGLSRLS